MISFGMATDRRMNGCGSEADLKSKVEAFHGWTAIKNDKIDQGRGGKDETWESRKSGNEDLNRPRHFGPRNTRNDAKGNPSLKLRT
jgi:hypothetical protein